MELPSCFVFKNKQTRSLIVSLHYTQLYPLKTKNYVLKIRFYSLDEMSNIASAGTATQINDYQSSTPASDAIDGNTDGYWSE